MDASLWVLGLVVVAVVGVAILAIWLLLLTVARLIYVVLSNIELRPGDFTDPEVERFLFPPSRKWPWQRRFWFRDKDAP